MKSGETGESAIPFVTGPAEQGSPPKRGSGARERGAGGCGGGGGGGKMGGRGGGYVCRVCGDMGMYVWRDDVCQS